MKRLLLLFAALLVFGFVPAMFADIVDYSLNVNGTTYCPGTGESCTNTVAGLGAVPGVSSSLDTSFLGTGLGTVSLTFNPGPGNYNVSLWLFEQLFPATAANEFGIVSVIGPASGQTWQIDVPDSTYAGELGAGAGTIVGNNAGSTLDNTNHVPGGVNDDDLSCFGDPNCNDYTSMALGFNFTLLAGEQEFLTFKVSNTAPASGFYLEQVAPVDSANSQEINYFFSATAETQPVGTNPVPEPSSWVFVVTVGIIMLLFRRRLAA